MVMEELGERKRRRPADGSAGKAAAAAAAARELSPAPATPAQAANGKSDPKAEHKDATAGSQGSLGAAAAISQRAQSPAAGKRERGSEDGSDGEAEDRLFCLCQQPYSPEQAMVSCDACGEWWHLRCVGISQSHARSAKVYHCPFCRSLRVRILCVCS